MGGEIEVRRPPGKRGGEENERCCNERVGESYDVVGLQCRSGEEEGGDWGVGSTLTRIGGRVLARRARGGEGPIFAVSGGEAIILNVSSFSIVLYFFSCLFLKEFKIDWE